MYGLSIGIAQVGTTLPPAVFALLSGLNAATVGIIALAAVQLSEKTITDKLSRLLVFFAGVAGMLYTALWYFPTLMVVAGFATFVWDYKFLQRGIGFLRRKGLLPRRRVTEPVEDAEAIPAAAVESQDATYNTGRSSHDGRTTPSIRRIGGAVSIPLSGPLNDPSSSVMEAETPSDEDQRIIPPRIQPQAISWKTGVYILAGFVLSFILVMVLRGTLSFPPLGFRLFANLYLAGTIIFGGGPVVIPLLREYVVAESWVSPRDFLLGLAIIQSFPGPNFNFAVYLGSLALSNSLAAPSAATGFLGGLIGFLAIFAPGIVIVTGFMGLWRVLRTKRWMTSFLRGVNAAAVGLVYTAVWKLWGIGYVDAANSTGSSLGINAWWVAVTACSFVGSRWFGVPAPAAIIGGGVLGLLRFAVVGA
jgi:chromate transport protein ChrA